MARLLETDWFPTQGPKADEPIFAIGDVHGQADLLAQMLDVFEVRSRHIGPHTLIFTGDLIDRGPKTLDCIEMALACERRFSQSYILPGNHELMMLGAMINARDRMPYWLKNGGETLLRELHISPEEPMDTVRNALQNVLPDEWLYTLKTGPTSIEENGLIFVHAGIDPQMDRQSCLTQSRSSGLVYNERHWAWIIEPFKSWTDGWDEARHDIVVHGHVPMSIDPIATEHELGIYANKASDHRRICLDASLTSLTQVAGLEIVKDRFRIYLMQGK